MMNERKPRSIADRAFFSYLTLFVLQLKVIWGMWGYRDLTPGDTVSYYCGAYMWFEKMAVNIIWSPLYTAFYGSMLHISRDAYVATILHRIIIIFAATLLVLGLMRKLLPPLVAWLVAVWWAILPVNFNCLYEVHLFSVVPVILAWLAIGWRNSPWARGAAVAILFASTILVRNELSVPTGILAVCCLFWDLRRAKRSGNGAGIEVRRLLPAYGIPLLVAVAVCGFFYERSIIKYPALKAASEPKHTLNMAQVYAAGYQQRHPEWTKSPWADTAELMERDFGAPLLPIGEMIKRNPRAMLEHFSWNAGLSGNGLQVLLFDATSGSINPDYTPVHAQSRTALLLSVFTGVLIVLGLTLVYRARHFWWRAWLKERAFCWLAMASVVAVAPLVIAVERPRPSYLFTLGLFIMAVVGMCVFAITRRWPAIERLSRGAPAVMLSLSIFVPSYYLTQEKSADRPILSVYRRLAPFEDVIAAPSTTFLVSGPHAELLGYVAHRGLTAEDESRMPGYSYLRKLPPNVALDTYLNERGVNLIFVNDQLWSILEKNPLCGPLLEQPQAVGWEIVSLERTEQGRSMLLRKKMFIQDDPVLLRRMNHTRDIVPMPFTKELRKHGTLPADGILLGPGWSDPENGQSGIFRWAQKDPQIVVTAPSGNMRRLAVDVEPDNSSEPLEFQVSEDGAAATTVARINSRTTIVLDLPIVSGRGMMIQIHARQTGLLGTNGGPSVGRFRAFGCKWE